MIIQCESCARKFVVKDKDIPKEGRVVQCGYCSVTWHQMPTFVPVSAAKSVVKKNVPIEKVKASDGRIYQFLGNQWAQLLPSGKTGLLAKKAIAKELNKLTGKKEKSISKKKKKTSRDVDPSSADINNSKRLPEIYKPKQGLGLFGYVFLLIIITIAIVGVLITFERELLTYFPKAKYIFETFDNMILVVKNLIKSDYIYETFDNIIIIVRELIKSF